MLINGQWTDGTGTERLDSYNPFDQSVWATIPQATEADVAAAIEAGHEAFRTVWRKTAGRDRAAMMLRLADLIEEHADALARIDSTDTCHVLSSTQPPQRFTTRTYRHFTDR